MRHRYSTPTVMNSVLASVAGLVLLLLASLNWVDAVNSFIAITFLILIYMVLEISRLRREHPLRWLINPVVLCSILTFGLGYSATNYLYFLPRELLASLGIEPVVSVAMVKLMYLTLIAVIAMWLGYWSSLAKYFTQPNRIARFQRRFVPSSQSVRPLVLPALVILSVAARLVAVKLGVFGYSSNMQRLYEASAYTQYIGLISGFGKLALVLAALQYYSPGKNLHAGSWLVAILLLEILFGFLSGFKSAVAMPFVIVGLIRYLRVGNVPLSWIAFSLIGIMVAYAVIEPFRDARMRHASTIDTNITGIASTMVDAYSSDDKSTRSSGPLYLSVLGRSNMVYIGSLGLDFADAHENLPQGSPEFLENIILAPLYAWIPRAIWESKPLGNLGLWYTRAVIRNNYSVSSTAMGPITYMYFAGGAFGGFVLFYFIGIIQRCFMFLFTPWKSLAGGLIFIATLPILVQIDSAVDGIFVNLFREFPLVLLLTHFLFRRPSHSDRPLLLQVE